MISPSPWSVSEKRVYVKDADGENVCAVSHHGDIALIAAAPDLLAACKAMREHCPAYQDITREWNAAWILMLQAVMKAEGR